MTYQGEVLQKRVLPLAEQIRATVIGELDVTNDDQIAATFAALRELWGGLDMLVHAVAFAEREDLRDRFLTVSRANFARSMEISAYSLVALARAAEPLMESAGGGAIRHPQLPRRGPRDAQLQHDGRGQSGSGSLRALSRPRPRAEKHPHQRAQRRPRTHAFVRRHPRLSRHGARSRARAPRCAARWIPTK